MKKTITYIIVALVVLLIIGGIGSYYYISTFKTAPAKTSATSSDGSASMSATFYDLSGNAIQSGTAQALLNSRTVKYTNLKLDLKVSNTGSSILTNVIPVNPNTNIGNIFANVIPLSSLSVGASNILVGTSAQACASGLDTACDTHEECCNATSCQKPLGGSGFTCLIKLNDFAVGTGTNNVVFQVSLQGNYTDAYGNQVAKVSTPITLTYDITEEKCTDGTGINTAVFGGSGTGSALDSNKGMYCKFVSGSAPSIIENCTLANTGCPSGESCNAGNNLCGAITCPDGTVHDTKSSATGTYVVSGIAGVSLTGGYTLLNAQYNKTRAYCNATGSLVLGCSTLIGTPSQACGLDGNGGQATTCAGTIPNSICQLLTYTGGISGCIPNCVGVTSGQSDNCGSTCP